MWRWLKSNLQSLGSVAAITVSVVALYVAWDQSRVMRAQQHADVWPALQIGTQYVTMDEYLTIELERCSEKSSLRARNTPWPS